MVAKALREAAEARWRAKGNPAGAPPALGAPLAEAKGSELERLRFRHPWIDRDSPVLLADYVTLDTGTGIVHTAPGHGWDDYLTGVRYGLDIYCPVDEAGRFLPEVEHFAGQRVFDANPAVVELLREKGALLQSGKDTHSYPICWRCKNPIIFRATEQWFIALDEGRPTLREQALEAIAQSRWLPAWGEERIRNMIATRPDWCISRQRLWGVPIPAFYCKGCGEILLRADLARHVAGLFEAETADAWYAREAGELLPAGFACPKCGGAAFDKETDILDVWFDSGSSHAAVLGHRDDLPWPADVYLEGSDQHRGWFHSSLLIGVATRGHAPYRQVITHGFTVDGEGRKISKSLGNDVDTQKLINTYGAEVLRLWTIMVDYREDMRISDDMIKRVAEAYRKVRNTIRYLVSNLNDFDPVPGRRGRGGPRRPRPLRPRPPPAGRRPRARRLRGLRVPPRLPPARAVRGVRPLLLLPRRAEGPALLRRRGRARDAAPPRPCSTGSRGTCASSWPPSSPSPRTRPGPSSPAARSPPSTWPSSLRARRRTRRSSPAGPASSTCGPRSRRPSRRPAPRSSWPRASRRAVVLRGPAGALEPAAGPRGEEPRLPRQPRQPVHRERRAAGGGRGPASASRSSTRRARSASAAGRGRRAVGTLAVHPGVCERCAEVLARP